MATEQPVFAFTIPSLFDELPLDCRIYHPAAGALANDEQTTWKGAIVAHPYAPLGGSYDDAVVLALKTCLLRNGFIVATFNFRGAGGSEGKTSWTGRPEVEDYTSVVGFMLHYLSQLRRLDQQQRQPIENDFGGSLHPTSRDPSSGSEHIQLLLAGYSFGSLVLARIPSVPAIIARFETAELHTPAAECMLRARFLAQKTAIVRPSRQPATIPDDGDITSPRLRPADPHTSPRRASPVTVGGEESPLSERRHRRQSSRDSRRSGDGFVREIPQRLKQTIQRQSESLHKIAGNSAETATSMPSDSTTEQPKDGPIGDVDVRYLLVSPVLLPFSTILAPAGVPTLPGGFGVFHRKATAEQDVSPSSVAASGFAALDHPTLVAFGDKDSFTAAKRLQQWAERTQASARPDCFEWTEFDNAGHFWREKGAMRALTKRISGWLAASSQENHRPDGNR